MPKCQPQPGQCGHFPCRIDFTDDKLAIRYINIPEVIGSDAIRTRETRRRAYTVCLACDTHRAREGRYYACGGYFVDSVVAVVCHIEIVGAIGGDGITPWYAGQRYHLPCPSNLADCSVPGIRHIHITSLVSGYARGITETRCTTSTVGTAFYAGGSSERHHLSHRCDLADDVVAGIRYIDIASAVRGHARGRREARICSSSVGETCYCSSAGQGCYGPARCNLADHIVTGIRHVDITGIVGCYAAGARETRCRTGTISVTGHARSTC